jgi:septum formation inhibitor-activating ATPase MinD
MAELIDVFNAMVRRTNWDKITDEEKDKNFFIINRYFSKKYVEQAQLLNLKNIDKVVGMELWYQFIKNEPYPKFFFSKSDTKDKSVLTKKEYKMLLVSLKIKPDDLDYLIEKHFDFIKEELSLLVKLYKQ